MIVMKFGGTSVADAGHLRAAARVVAGRRHESPAVVVSAQSGITESLLQAADHARGRQLDELAVTIDGIASLWHTAVEELDLSSESAARARGSIDDAIGMLRDLTQGVSLLGECSPRSRDSIAALGELVSHRLMALALVAEGVPARPIDPRELVLTDCTAGEAQVDGSELARRCAMLLLPVIDSGAVPVTGGYVGATMEGTTTTLGRGGSDLTATHLAAALGAQRVEIWTDVDGMMTADPRIVATARPLRRMNFEEASELASFGARVLHPATIRPAIDSRIPVRVLNTLSPDLPGTTINGAPRNGGSRPTHLLAVVAKKDIAVVSVRSSRMLGAHGFLARVFAVFDRHRIPVDVVTTSEVSVSVTIDRLEHLRILEVELAVHGRVRVETERALVCLVGRGLLASPDTVGQAVSSLDGLPLDMVCLGTADINLTLVLPQSHADEAVRRLHARFLEVRSDP